MELRARLLRDDDYARAGKPVCDYDDAAARSALVDALAQDAYALLAVLDGRQLAPALAQAGELLATVVGQDLEQDPGQLEGVFRIARRVAPDRVISTVDPQARHGRKTSAHGFDGYKGHVGIDPDSEIITATGVSAANTGDAEAAGDLLADDLASRDHQASNEAPAGPAAAGSTTDAGEPLAVYGDAAYGAGAFLADLDAAGATNMCKVQPPTAPAGRFAKDMFDIDLDAATVRCPGEQTARIRPTKDGGGTAVFGALCQDCPLVAQCTASTAGRTIRIGPHEAHLAKARAAQTDPAWRADYRATRPKVERKIGHLMRRRHGGRRARVRGRTKIAADFSLLAAAVNLARLGVLELAPTSTRTWVAATN